ncbi:MAG: glyceraldehyde 3-phosphate dehydrogenase NAD-binding domain-containing protein, partial [Patescibacteria group bacterium]
MKKIQPLRKPKIRVAINGYGRIGRCFHRQILGDSSIEIVAINSRSDAATHAHLLKYDSIYGTLPNKIDSREGELIVDGDKIKVFEGIPGKDFRWDDLKIDVVIEATGMLVDYTRAEMHLSAGARKVLVTAPCNDIRIPTFVMGVN